MNDKKDIYIVLISLHGLIRAQNLELGRDADTGGQILYVLELAEALSRQEQVKRVDLVTRRISDPKVSPDYARPIETINDKLRIVRVEAGPKKYILKEDLWDYLSNFADNLNLFFKQQNQFPDLIHSHYADAGWVGAQLANGLAIPLVFTGHSLGRVKRNRLIASGFSSDAAEQYYHLSRRIEAEELTLATAERVITSTHQEIEEQYELYDYYQPDQMRVLPPGTNLKQFVPPLGIELQSDVYEIISRHLKTPDKPIILALSRPDKRKNIAMLIEAYGQSPALQQRANLVIVAGNRDDLDDLDADIQDVFHELFVAIDRYDLYGKVALPKQHRREQVADFYRLAAFFRGVFVNPALTEPFGLTLIEAAACGLPIVATEDGGPRDIIANCQNGLLVDPLEPKSIADALLKLLSDPLLWQMYSDQGLEGVARYYAWDAHADHYLHLIDPLIQGAEPLLRNTAMSPPRLYHDRALVTDLDQNLLGDVEALKRLLELLRAHRKTTLFVIATGRRLDSALKLMKQFSIPQPDVLITSGGTEIYYAPKLTVDIAWSKHIDFHWAPHKVRTILAALPGLEKQPKPEQSRYKLSYYINTSKTDPEHIRRLLHQEEQSVNVMFSFGQYLDILPIRASKGLALRYVADRRDIPLNRIFVAGGSGADEDMMRGNTLAAVVSNRHHEELSQLDEVENIYFAENAFAAGIIEALSHYDFFNLGRVPKTH